MISVDLNQVANVLAFEEFLKFIKNPDAMVQMIQSLKDAKVAAEAAVAEATQAKTIADFKAASEKAVDESWAEFDKAKAALEAAKVDFDEKQATHEAAFAAAQKTRAEAEAKLEARAAEVKAMRDSIQPSLTSIADAIARNTQWEKELAQLQATLNEKATKINSILGGQ